MNVDKSDFSKFTLKQKVRHFEVVVYFVLPDVLGAASMEEIDAEMMADASMRTMD